MQILSLNHNIVGDSVDNLISVLRFLDNLEELHLDVMDITSGDFNSLSLQLSDCKKIKFLGLGYNKLDNGCLTTLSVLLDSLLLHGRVSPRCYPDIIQISHEVVRFYHITEILTADNIKYGHSCKKASVVNPDAGVHANLIEGFWCGLKCQMKPRNRIKSIVAYLNAHI